MAQWQFRVVFRYRSNMPEDVTVNTWAFNAPPGQPGLQPIAQLLIDFYNEPTIAGNASTAVGHWMSPAISRELNDCSIEIYEVDTSNPGPLGSPVFVVPWTLRAGPTSPQDVLPNECALVTSFAGNAGPGESSARRRGRVYLGPFRGEASVANLATFQPRVTGFLVEAAAAATQRLVQQADALPQSGLCVWSRADSAFHPVTRGFVDGEWDTQRRRGVEPQSRVAWQL